MFVLDQWYTRPMPEAGHAQVGELEQDGIRIRHFGILVRNRPTRWPWPHRKIAENITSHLLIRGTAGDEKTFHGVWTVSTNGRQFTAPGAQTSLTVGQKTEIPVVLKIAGEKTCQLIHNENEKLSEEFILPEGTYLVALTLVYGGKSTPYYFVLNNRTTELARLKLRGPVTKKAVRHIINNPEAYFPLGGTG